MSEVEHNRILKQVSIWTIPVLLVVALCTGSGIVLAANVGIYLAVGLLALGSALLLLGPVIHRLMQSVGLPTIALACSLFWFSTLEFIVGTKIKWVQLYRGIFIRVQGIGAGLFILPIAVLLLLKYPIRLKIRRIDLLGFVLAACAVLGVFTMAVGILRGNNIGYVIGDAYKFVLPTFVYVFCVKTFAQPKRRRFLWQFLVLNGIFISTLGMFFQLYKFAVYWPYSLLGKDIDLFTLAVSALLYVSSPSRRIRVAAFLATVVLVTGAAVSLERRDWLYVVLVFALVAILKKGKPRYRLVRLALAGCSLIVIIVVILNLVLPNLSSRTMANLKMRLDRTITQKEQDSSVVRRTDEMRFVIQEFNRVSPIYVLIGLGQGAEFYDPDSGKAGSRKSFVHNVHNTYTSVFFRTGVAGLVLIVGFVFLSLRLSHRCVRYARREGDFLDNLFLQAALIYLLISFAVTWNVTSSIGEIPVPAMVGLLAATARWQLRPRSADGSMRPRSIEQPNTARPVSVLAE